MAVEYGALRAELRLTDGNLNRHLKVLEDAELVPSSWQTGRGRPKTWITITDIGRRAPRPS